MTFARETLQLLPVRSHRLALTDGGIAALLYMTLHRVTLPRAAHAACQRTSAPDIVRKLLQRLGQAAGRLYRSLLLTSFGISGAIPQVADLGLAIAKRQGASKEVSLR